MWPELFTVGLHVAPLAYANPPCAAIYQDALNDIPASDLVDPDEFFHDLGEWDPELENWQQDIGEDDFIAAGVILVDGAAVSVISSLSPIFQLITIQMILTRMICLMTRRMRSRTNTMRTRKMRKVPNKSHISDFLRD